MSLQLSWDLFIIVFFSIVVAYSYIMGREDTLKVIIATYIATISADGIGNIIQKFLGSSDFFMKLINFLGFDGASPDQMTGIIKIILLIAIIVVLTIFGDYDVQAWPTQGAFMGLIILGLIAILSGGLILSTIIVFANGGSLISGQGGYVAPSFISIYEQSKFVRGLLDWHDLWFSLPGVLFATISVLQKNKTSS